MNLRHLEVFRHVMQTGTIKGAAAVLMVSNAAASKLLATAERRMGLVLFERAHGRLIPTPEARRLYEDVEQLWNRVDRIKALTHSLAHPKAGTVSTGISPSFGVKVVPRTTAALLAEMPELRINVDLMLPYYLLQSVIEGSSDVGVLLNPQQHPSLEIIDRFRCGLVCVMPNGHELSARKYVRASDLAGRSVVAFHVLDYGLTDEMLFGRYSSSILRQVSVHSGLAACWFSDGGAGLAVVDAVAVAGGAFPNLTIRPYRCEASLDIFLLRRRGRPLSRPAQHFCESFRRTWKEMSQRHS